MDAIDLFRERLIRQEKAERYAAIGVPEGWTATAEMREEYVKRFGEVKS